MSGKLRRSVYDELDRALSEVDTAQECGRSGSHAILVATLAKQRSIRHKNFLDSVGGTMTTSEQNEIPQPGSIIRYAAWNGVVLDVFASTSSGKHILQIMFAKNIYKQQPAELHVYEDLRGGLLLPSSREALDEELKRLNENALGEVDNLLAKITMPVEVPAVATGE